MIYTAIKCWLLIQYESDLTKQQLVKIKTFYFIFLQHLYLSIPPTTTTTALMRRRVQKLKKSHSVIEYRIE